MATTRSSRRPGRTLLAAGVAAVALGVSACSEGPEPDVTVESLRFEGNEAFSDGDLARVMVTRKTGFLPWSRPQPFDQVVFEADLRRLRAFYRDRGYPDARVVDIGIDFNESGDAVDLTVQVDEGEPVLVERIEYEGFVGLAPGILDRVRTSPLREGHPFDRRLVLESRDHAIFVLKDNGFPHPRVESRDRPGSTDRQVIVTLVATPGQAAVFGAVSVENNQRVSDTVVERTLVFRPGQPYRISHVLESQRRLFDLGLFEFAHVEEAGGEAPSSNGDGQDAARLPMRVTVTEGRPTTLRLGVGYGSEEGPRGSIDWRHRNFFGAARQFGAEGRYSNRLRGGGVDFVQPYVGTAALSLNLNTGAWWANEPNYSSRSIGFRGGFTYRRTIELGLNRIPVENVARITYINESLRHTIKPDVLEDLEALEELVALGIDPTSGTSSGRLGALELSLARTSVDDALDPHEGYSVSLRLEHAAPWLAGTHRYNEAHIEGRFFLALGNRIVWATRSQIGALLARADEDVPFSARYFLGGSTTLRGWGRFQVAPLTSDGLPIGGRAIFDVTTEVRVPLSGSFGAVGFVDAGNVWPKFSELDLGDLRVAVGPGLRWASGFGVVRADVGVQINPIPNLLVDAQPERRRWRIHFSFGHAF